MFRILLVEDEPLTREELTNLLHEDFPDLLLKTAANVAEAQQALHGAVAEDCPFDIAILDFKLPERPGENPEPNESLCQIIKAEMPVAFVLHITAFPDDDIVIRHLARHHAQKNTPRAHVIHKTAGWSKKLRGEIKAHLIERQINTLFGNQTDTANVRKAFRSSSSLTHALAALSRDIAAYWANLDDATKDRIREFFELVEDPPPVRVNLRLRR